jgi:hypothetical protein
VTYNGVAMTAIDTKDTAGSRVALFYLVAPATGANNVVVSSTLSAQIYSQSASYTGVSQTGVPDASAKTTDSASPRRISVTSIADNCWMMAYFGQAAVSDTQTQESGTVIRSTVVPSVSLICDSNTVITPAGSYTLGTTSVGAAEWAIVGATFKPPSAAGPANIKTHNGIAAASVKTVNGVAIASVKTRNGIN